jgi:hypothetical protein
MQKKKKLKNLKKQTTQNVQTRTVSYYMIDTSSRQGGRPHGKQTRNCID